jgi:hypothetical protein
VPRRPCRQRSRESTSYRLALAAPMEDAGATTVQRRACALEPRRRSLGGVRDGVAVDDGGVGPVGPLDRARRPPGSGATRKPPDLGVERWQEHHGTTRREPAGASA